MEKIIYHGSDHIIEQPEFGYGKPYNDYGIGFYCTENPNMAKEWGVGIDHNGYANQYQINCDGLSILDLHASEYTLLHWLTILLENREFDTSTPLAAEAKEYLIQKFHLDYKSYDIIIGYRADDSYTQVIEAFLLNQINLYEVERLFYKGSLGNQIFLKSEKAFKEIHWQNAYQVALSEEDKKFDLYARREVSKFLAERMRSILLNGYEVPGITARYAVSHLLKYDKESGEYENAGI